jgi:hypothetical protein
MSLKDIIFYSKDNSDLIREANTPQDYFNLSDTVVYENNILGFTIDSVLSLGSLAQLGDVDFTSLSPSISNNNLLMFNNNKWVHTNDVSLGNITASTMLTTIDSGLTIGSTVMSASASELNILDGATVSTDEINYLDITTLGTSEASKVLTANASGDVIVPDSDKFQFGAGLDMTLYHDGTDSYITNKTGALKIATETSGIAVTIGHTTSEVTVADNLNVIGDLTVDTSVLKVDSTNNRIGIGTNSPSKVLHVVDTTADSEIARFQGADGNLSIQSGSKITFTRNSNNYLTCTSTSGALVFETGGGGNNRLSISSTGISTFTNNVVLDNAKSLVLSELDSNGSNTVSIKAPDSVTADVTLVLPDGAGTNGQALTTDGSGNLSWAAVSGFKTYSSKTATFTAAINNHYSVNTTSGAVVVNLPQISTTTEGESLVIKFREGTNTLTLSPYSGNTIEGLANLIMTDSQSPGQSITLVTDGTSAWEII